MRPFKWERVLVTTDFSRFANSAIGYAHALAEKFDAELHVLHVVRDISEAVPEYGATGLFDAGSTEDARSAWLSELLGERGTVRRVEAVRVGNDEAAVIAEYAARHEIDLVVMATHGRTGLAHLLMGSVAEKVLRTAPCPVLVVKP
jgi:nucleotide-binding universal stress UspA family protein